MNVLAPMEWVWLLAGTGAVLFFWAGMLLSAARWSTPTSTSPSRTDADEPTEIGSADLMNRVLFAEAEGRTARLDLEQQSVQMVALAHQAEAMNARLLTQSAQLTASDLEKTALSEQLIRFQEDRRVLSDETVQLKRRIEALEQAENEFSRVLDQERAQAGLARQELAAAKARIPNWAEPSSSPAVVALLQRSQTAETERRAQLTELDVLRQECKRLRTETEALRARLVARPAPRSRPIGGATLIGTANRGSAFQSVVDQLTRSGEAKTAVIADDLGLVVAASGELGDELAAAAAMVSHTTHQIRQFLPLSPIHRITLQDEHNIALSVSPLFSDGDSLSLVTLALENQHEDALVDRDLEPRTHATLPKPS